LHQRQGEPFASAEKEDVDAAVIAAALHAARTRAAARADDSGATLVRVARADLARSAPHEGMTARSWKSCARLEGLRG
jgi:hypothetical protein